MVLMDGEDESLSATHIYNENRHPYCSMWDSGMDVGLGLSIWFEFSLSPGLPW